MRKRNKKKEETSVVEEIVAEVTQESVETETTEEAKEAETVEATEEAKEAEAVEATEEAEEAEMVETTEEAKEAEAVEATEEAEEAETVETTEEAKEAETVEATEEAEEAETVEAKEAEEAEAVEVTEGAEAPEEAEASEEAEAVEATEGEEVPEEAESTEESAAKEDAKATEDAKASEESAAAEEPAAKPGMKLWKKVMIIVGVLLVVLAAVYFGLAKYYSDRFFLNTTVNGVDCAGKTVSDVEQMMQNQVEAYVLTLEEVNDVTEEIKGVDIGIKYIGFDVIQEAFAAQNSYTWFTSLYQKNDIQAVVEFEYDSAKLEEVISQLECLKEENQVAPVTAKPVLTDGTYEIQEEVYGTQIHLENLNATIQAGIEAMETTVNLEEKECYILPAYTKESAEVIALVDALNKCLTAEITYSLDGTDVKLDREKIIDWLSYDDTMNLLISTEGVSEFVSTLSSTYNTAPRTQHITTPTGKEAYVSGATVGRTIGASAECERLIGDIQEGLVTTRQPIIAQNATPEGQYAWGNTYTEVDISAQHMWYIVDGQPVFETAVITGNPNMRWGTPAGIFKILEKLSPKTLRGNIDPSTGQPEYIQPVDYWARVTWGGVGFHDCTWHQTFGGDIYLRNGSHGCINMPPDAAAEFYGMVYVGCPVIIHY